MDKIAVVAINGTMREFDKPYHYLVPEEFSDSLFPGMRVIVPFGNGNSLKEGYVLSFAENSEYSRIKSIKKIVDKKPVLTGSQILLAAWMKQRYFCTYAAAIKCMLPAGIDVKTLKIVRLAGTAETDPAKLTPSQKSIISTLEANDGLLEIEELKRLSNVKTAFSKQINILAEKGRILMDEQYSAAVREKYVRVAELAMSREEVETDIQNGVIKRIQQIRILEMLLENEYIAVADLARFASVSTSVIDTLRKNNYIYYRDIEVKRDPLRHRDVTETSPMEPTPEQEEALGRARALVDCGRFDEMLLHGVTGSGKTEVYLQLIQYVLEKGRQAIVLVPEISLTPQMTDRFRGRFGNRVAVLHSRLSLGERYDQWRLIRNGEVQVVVGARSAVFAPFENLGLIIIDEEHENSYKSETTPKYSAAQVAARRCQQDGALLLYGSATPSIETFHRAMEGEIKLVTMKVRANALVMPEVRLVDMRMELEAGNRTMFSAELSEEIRRNIASGQQTILFLNRRGYSSFILCRNCGIRIKCRYCSVTMTYHSADDRLICHYCGYTEKMPTVCPECGSSYIRQFGAGTQKIEEDLQKYFPGCSVIRMDMDTTTGKHSHEEILDAFREKNINILVGTQMIAKGHDFPNVTLVGVLAADSLLGMDDFRASERTFQLLTQVSGRAGRGELPGRVVIQTYNTDDYSIVSSCSYDYDAFYRQETDIRSRLRYPPFTNIASIVVSSPNDKLACAKAKETAALLSSLIDAAKGDELMPGPARAPAARLRNRYRWRLLIKCDSQDRLAAILSAASDGFWKSRGSSDVDLNMDINPISML
ncbi:MAG TPA: primosomal protein N' [Clostridia bacterium]|nr:primosomal protein N' [Clostridia bacterium]